MSAPTPPRAGGDRSAMVEKVASAMVEKVAERLQDEIVINDYAAERMAKAAIAAVFDNLPRQVMMLVVERMMKSPLPSSEIVQAIIAAAKREVLGHE